MHLAGLMIDLELPTKELKTGL